MAAGDIPVPVEALLLAIVDQVQAYDARFLKGLQEMAGSTNATAQAQAFGRRDGTGVEAVHDVMPPEGLTFERLAVEAAMRKDTPVMVLDFGCGDGRYLQQYLRTAEVLQDKYNRGMHVVAYEVSIEALRSFYFRARRAGLAEAATEAGNGGGNGSTCNGLNRLYLRQLQVQFLSGDGGMGIDAVAQVLRGPAQLYDIVAIGWGTLSAIPRTPSMSAEALLKLFADIACVIMNVTSTTNNHVRFQREFAARRRAFAETTCPKVRQWLQSRIRLAIFSGSYYYPVNTGQCMFYAAVTAEDEARRLAAAGFEATEVRICNIINFFDILTKPRAKRLNDAVIRLLERGDAWGAQLLLSRGVAKAFRRPLHELRTASCIFDASSALALRGQVARYFISTGRSPYAQRSAHDQAIKKLRYAC